MMMIQQLFVIFFFFFLLLLDSFKYCDSQSPSCAITVNATSHVGVVTCRYFQFRTLRATLNIQRFNIHQSLAVETITACAWGHDDYNCTLYNPLFQVQYDSATRILELTVPSAEIRKGDYYVCGIEGQLNPPQLCPLPLSAPSQAPKLRVTTTTSSTITVSWTEGGGGGIPIQGFELMYKRTGDMWISIPLGPSRSSYTVLGLLCGTLYHFALRTFNTQGNSSMSDAISAFTNGSEPSTPKRRELMPRINDTSILIDLMAWHTPGCPINYFSFRCRLWNETKWRLHDNVTSDKKELHVSSLLANSFYELEITAHNDAGSTPTSLRFKTLPIPKLSKAKPEHSQSLSSFQRTCIAVGIAVGVVLVVVVVVGVYFKVYRARRGDRSMGGALTSHNDDVNAEDMETHVSSTAALVSEEYLLEDHIA